MLAMGKHWCLTSAMQAKGATFQKFLLGLALLSALAWNLVHAAEIEGVQLSAGATGTRAEIALDASAEFKIISLAGPDRLVVDLPGATLASGAPLAPGAGVVKAVRTGHPVAGTVRIVFDLSQSITALKPRIEPSTPSARSIARASVDLPAPRSPSRWTTAESGRARASARPSRSVSALSASCLEIRVTGHAPGWQAGAAMASGRSATSHVRHRRQPHHPPRRVAAHRNWRRQTHPAPVPAARR